MGQQIGLGPQSLPGGLKQEETRASLDLVSLGGLCQCPVSVFAREAPKRGSNGGPSTRVRTGTIKALQALNSVSFPPHTPACQGSGALGSPGMWKRSPALERNLGLSPPPTLSLPPSASSDSLAPGPASPGMAAWRGDSRGHPGRIRGGG